MGGRVRESKHSYRTGYAFMKSRMITFSQYAGHGSCVEYADVMVELCCAEGWGRVVCSGAFCMQLNSTVLNVPDGGMKSRCNSFVSLVPLTCMRILQPALVYSHRTVVHVGVTEHPPVPQMSEHLLVCSCISAEASPLYLPSVGLVPLPVCQKATLS